MKRTTKIAAALLSLSLIIPMASCQEKNEHLSAYDIAIKNGFVGSESEWLDSLVGETGAKGDKGDPGETGAKGDKGDPGENGAKGDKGDPGETGAKGDKGDPGETGPQGVPGENGKGIKSVYVNDNLHLIIVFDDNTEMDAGYVGTGEVPEDIPPQIASEYECIRPGELLILEAGAGDYSWRSSNTAVARVTEDGLILGVGEGECVITATSRLGVEESCTVRVVDLEYKMNADGGLTITAYNGISSELVIPEKIGTHTVTAIDDYAFFTHETLESVILPDTLKIIGDGAFSNCKKLTSINLGNSVTYVGNASFSTTALTAIDLPDTVTYIGYTAFYGTSIESVVIPDGVAVLAVKD